MDSETMGEVDESQLSIDELNLDEYDLSDLDDFAIEEKKDEWEPIRLTAVEKVIMPLLPIAGGLWMIAGGFAHTKIWMRNALYMSWGILTLSFLVMAVTLVLAKKPKPSKFFNSIASNTGGLFFGMYAFLVVLTIVAKPLYGVGSLITMVIFWLIWSMWGRPIDPDDLIDDEDDEDVVVEEVTEVAEVEPTPAVPVVATTEEPTTEG